METASVRADRAGWSRFAKPRFDRSLAARVLHWLAICEVAVGLVALVASVVIEIVNHAVVPAPNSFWWLAPESAALAFGCLAAGALTRALSSLADTRRRRLAFVIGSLAAISGIAVLTVAVAGLSEAFVWAATGF